MGYVMIRCQCLWCAVSVLMSFCSCMMYYVDLVHFSISDCNIENYTLMCLLLVLLLSVCVCGILVLEWYSWNRCTLAGCCRSIVSLCHFVAILVVSSCEWMLIVLFKKMNEGMTWKSDHSYVDSFSVWMNTSEVYIEMSVMGPYVENLVLHKKRCHWVLFYFVLFLNYRQMCKGLGIVCPYVENCHCVKEYHSGLFEDDWL